MAIYSAGTAYLQVVPSFRGIEKLIADEVEKIGRSAENAIAKALPDGIADGMKEAGKTVEDEGAKAGEKWAGAWASAVQRRLKSTLKAIPEVELKADSSDFDKALRSVRDEIKELSEADITVLDEREVIASIDRVAKRLARLEEEAPSVSDFINVREARAEFDALAGMTEQFGRRGAESGDEFAGRFIQTVNARLKAAIRQIPDVPLRIDASDADKELRILRQELVELSQLKIGVNIDESTFMARTRAVLERLREIERSDPSVQVRSDAAATIAELEVVLKLGQRVDDQNPKLKINTDVSSLRDLADEVGISLSRLGYLVSLGSSLGTVLVPAAAAAAVAVGAIGTAALAAAAGVGVIALSLFGIGDAVKALDAAQKDADKSAKNVSDSQARIAGAVDSVASAERSLANTRQSVAYQAQRAAQQVIDAERSVARAQQDAAEAVRDLVRAREEERRQQQDLALRVKANALSQRQANLDIADAKRDLDKVLSNPRATEEEREQARITYEQRVLQLQELTVQGQRMAADQKAQAKAGVDGSDRVRAAQERVRDTNERVAESQRNLAEAIEAQQQQQRQGAYQIQQAQQAVISAQRALQQATVASGVAGGEAMRNLKQAMDALSPAGQRFALFLFGLKDEFKQLRDAAQEAVLPGLQKAIETLLPYMPDFIRFIGAVGRAIGAMFEETVKFLSTDPTWREFFGFIGKSAIPTLRTWWEIAKNIGTALVALFLALTPFNGEIGGGLVDLTKRFADWAVQLRDSNGYQKFLDYVARTGPKVVDLIGKLGKFIGNVVIAAAPIGEFVLDMFIELFEQINKIPNDVLTILIGVLAGVAAAFLLVSAATAIFTSGYAALVILGIAAIALEWAILYKKVEPVRKAIDFALSAIGSYVNFLWKDIIQPAFRGIVWFIENILAPAFDWWYNHVVKPVFSLVQAAFNVLVAVIKVAIGLAKIQIAALGNAFSLLWNHSLKPLWERYILPFIKALGDIFDKYVLPYWKKVFKTLGTLWDGFVLAFKGPVAFLIDVILNAGILAAYNKIAKFFHVTPDNVKVEKPKGFATGGAINGPGTGTSDSVLIRASRGEHMWTAREVAAVGGHGAMAGLRQAALAGMLPGFRAGGPIGDGIGDLLGKARKKATDFISGVTDFISDPAGTLRKLADNLIKQIPGYDDGVTKIVAGAPRRIVQFLIDKVKGLFAGDDGGIAGPGGGPLGGSAGMMKILRVPFPGLRLISGFRPGSKTLSGNTSYHASDHAVDVPAIRAVAQWIRGHFGPGTLELITPWRELDLRNGRPHHYDNAVHQQHSGGNAHVHWAYDQGGMLPPGWSMAFNGTGQPEPVLSQAQWRDVRSLAGAGGRTGNTYNFAFAETRLTPGYLRALQDRDAVLERLGRPS